MFDLDPTYLEGCAVGELRLQRCQDCGTSRFPAASICPNCLSARAEWVAASGRGTVWSWIRMHQRYFKDLPREAPYNVALIELAEGPLMISALVDEAASPTIGAPVQVEFRAVDGTALPYFSLDLTTAGTPA